MWSQRLQSEIAQGNPFDLRDIVDGLTADREDEALAIIAQYADYRRQSRQLLDFEEIRRAFPWIFESSDLLRAAIDLSTDVAAALQQNPMKYADAIAASHPLARKMVAQLKEEWVKLGAPGDPSLRDVELPCGFGEGFDHDELRFRLERLVDRTPRSALYEATELLPDEAGGPRPVWINIFRSDESEKQYESHRPRLSATCGIAPERERGTSQNGSFYIAGEGVVYRRNEQNTNGKHSDPERLLRDFAEIAHAVARIHASGWVHGDISPRNLCITHDGRFSLIWREPGERAGIGDVDAMAYGPLNPGGCMAPEVYRGKPCIPSSDIYQFGALLGWVLTDQPLNGVAFNDAMDFLGGDASRQDPNLSTLPPAIRSLITECTSESASDRPVSMAIVQDRIERYLAKEPASRCAPTEVRVAMWIRRHYGPATVALLVLLALAVLGLSLLDARHQKKIQLVQDASLAERQRLVEAHRAQLQSLGNRLSESVAINQGSDVRERIANERVRQAEETIRSSVERTISVIRDWQHEILAIESTDPVRVLYILTLVETLEAADHELRNALLEDSTGIAIAEADQLWQGGDRTFSTALWHVLAARQLLDGGNQDHAALYLEKAETMLDGLPKGHLLGAPP